MTALAGPSSGPAIRPALLHALVQRRLSRIRRLRPSRVASTVTQTPLITWRPLAGRASYFVIVAKDPSFTNIVDYAFTQIPAYAPRTAFCATTYPDETTSYYWVVLAGCVQANGNGAVGNPLLGAPRGSTSGRNHPAKLGPQNGAVILRPADFPLDTRARRPPLSPPDRAGPELRRSDRRHPHGCDVAHEQHDLSRRHGSLLARARRRREPDRPHLVGDGDVPEAPARAGPEPLEPNSEGLHPNVDLELDHRGFVLRRQRRPSEWNTSGHHRAPNGGPHADPHVRHRALPLEGAGKLPEGPRSAPFRVHTRRTLPSRGRSGSRAGHGRTLPGSTWS